MDKPHITRRQFLRMIAAAGGTTAVWSAMDSWGLLAAPRRQQPPPLEGSGEGTRVVILGAGVAGMTAAHELGKLGYETPILEARDRAGGRVWSARRGTVSEEVGGEQQVCEFDEGLYMNPGPWRIPQHHHGTLHYIQEFNVPIEVFVNKNPRAYMYVEDVDSPLSGQKIRLNALWADMRGYTMELAAKAVNQDALDLGLSEEDVAMWIDYLVGEGLISRNELAYTGTSRRGYEVLPGGGRQPGEKAKPYPLEELLPYAAEAFQAAGYYIGAVTGFSQQMAMFQPVGGMDRIAAAFEEAVGQNISYQVEVQEIRQGEDGVRIVYQNRGTGETTEMTGDYCICTIPLPVLSQIPGDFDSEMRAAIQGVTYAPTGKIGLQMARRFWEEDENVMGGLTHTNLPIETIAYPSYGYLGQKGVLQGYYNFGPTAIETSNLSPQERIDFALEHGRKVHPQYDEAFENGFSVAWHRVRYNLGGWASYTEETRDLYYDRLNEPDGRVYLAGEHLSYQTGWMNGAIEAAWVQIEKLHERVMQA